MSLATEALIITSGPAWSRESERERENARNRRREGGREKENRQQRPIARDRHPREIMREREESERREARSGTANENDQQIATSSRWNGVSNSLEIVIVGSTRVAFTQRIANIPGDVDDGRNRQKIESSGPLGHASARAALVLRGGNDSC